MRKVYGKYNQVEEATWYEDKRHGLAFGWGSGLPFTVTIYNHGKNKAWIKWHDDWSMFISDGDKELIAFI